MKKLLLITTLVAGALVSYGQQGAVTFANSAGSPIRAFGTNVAATVALYGSTSTGLSSDASLTQVGATANTFTPGLFSGGARNIGNPGDTVTLQVRAWTGGFANWDAAFAAAQSNPNVFVTLVRPMWEQAVGGGTLPTQPITGAGRFGGAAL
jgi:hypothetical protein